MSAKVILYDLPGSSHHTSIYLKLIEMGYDPTVLFHFDLDVLYYYAKTHHVETIIVAMASYTRKEIKRFKNLFSNPLPELKMIGIAELSNSQFVYDRLFDYCLHRESSENLIRYAIHRKKNGINMFTSKMKSIKTPFWKRLFDILVSSVLILFLTPVYIGLILGVKISSSGPIFYVSKRVGMGYRIFNFLKFRSMRTDADQLLNTLKNTYESEKTIQNDHEQREMELVSDDGFVSESDMLDKSNKSKFIKIENDPRVTAFGRFIRNTSLDELPQLFNVLRGDMSLVGNRPLPLYEAEKLTTDQAIERFNAPAGITGLWQVTERGKKDVTEEGRIMLDNTYSQNLSFTSDLKILLKTLPAAIQKTQV